MRQNLTDLTLKHLGVARLLPEVDLTIGWSVGRILFQCWTSLHLSQAKSPSPKRHGKYLSIDFERCVIFWGDSPLMHMCHLHRATQWTWSTKEIKLLRTSSLLMKLKKMATWSLYFDSQKLSERNCSALLALILKPKNDYNFLFEIRRSILISITKKWFYEKNRANSFSNTLPC